MPLQDHKDEKYRYMWYKKNGSIGIAQKFGQKTQIWSFGVHSGKSEKALRKLGDDCVEKLDSGMSPDDVRTWVVAQCQQ